MDGNVSKARACPICEGSDEPGWVCEDHPGKPWGHDGCGAAGAPCVCNPKGVVQFVKVLAEVDRPDEEPLH